MNVKHLGLIAVTALVAAGLAGMSTSNAGAAVAAAPANCVIGRGAVPAQHPAAAGPAAAQHRIRRDRPVQEPG